MSKAVYEFDNIDRVLIKEKVENPKITNTKLAIILDSSTKTVKRHMDKPEVQKEIIRLQEENHKTALDLIKESQTKAVRKVLEIMESGQESNQLKAACELIKNLLATKIDLGGSKIDDLINEFRKKD